MMVVCLFGIVVVLSLGLHAQADQVHQDHHAGHKKENVKVMPVPAENTPNSENDDDSQELPEIAKNCLPCDKLQKCLNKLDRECWGEFYEENKAQNKNGSDTLVCMIFKQFTKTAFLAIVDKTEAHHHKEFLKADEIYAQCMADKGYRAYIDYCSSQRTYDSITRKKRQSKPSDEEGENPEEGNCWRRGLMTCMEVCPVISKRVAKDMIDCDKQFHITEVEARTAEITGKDIMTRVLEIQPVKELLDKINAESNAQFQKAEKIIKEAPKPEL